MKLLIGLFGLTLLLSGCTASPPAEPASPSQSNTSTPNTVASLVTLGGGSCDKFLQAATISRDLGTTLAFNPEFSEPDAHEAAIGGLGCRWYFGEQGDPAGGEADVSIVPASIATASVVSASTSSPLKCATNADLDTENSGCSFAGVVNGWWYGAALFTFVSPTAQSHSAHLLQSTINAALKSAHAPGTIATKTPLTCQAVDASINHGANLEHGSLSVQTDLPSDSSHMDSPLDFAITAIGETTCDWAGTDFSFSLTIDPGSFSVFRTCSARVGAKSVMLAGIKSAVVFPPDEGSLVLCASDGASTVELDAGGFTSNDADGWDQAHLDLAQKILVPVLASARP